MCSRRAKSDANDSHEDDRNSPEDCTPPTQRHKSSERRQHEATDPGDQGGPHIGGCGRSESVIEKMGLEDFLLRNVAELSGGEAQKVMLARALAQEPRVLLLDEPTSNLDPFNQHEVLYLMRKIAEEHDTCVVIIIHDLNLAIRYCDKFLLLKDSKVFSFGGVEVMTPENIEEVYGIHVHIIEHRGVPVVVPFARHDISAR